MVMIDKKIFSKNSMRSPCKNNSTYLPALNTTHVPSPRQSLMAFCHPSSLSWPTRDVFAEGASCTLSG